MSETVPKLKRRDFIRVGGVGVASYSLLPMLAPHNVEAGEKAGPRGGAEVCIVLFLQGGPAQMDTFDVKEGPWTPGDFDIQTIPQGYQMPVGLFPEISKKMDKYAILRGMEAWEIDHDRGRYYIQTGKVSSPAQMHEIPSVGSVIAYETMDQRKDSDFLPPFISMNSETMGIVGPGMLDSSCAPMNLFTDSPPPFLVPESEKTTMEIRRKLLRELDHEWREDDPKRGRIFEDLDHYYESAYPLLDDPRSTSIFTVNPEDHARYGSCGVGDACVIARNLVEADAGTKYIFIAHANWDLHSGAYGTNGKGGYYELCKDLDSALSGLTDDLESKTDSDGRRLLDKTFVVCMGEFGRTPGELTKHNGRDHYNKAAVGLFTGAGVVGGKALGTTDELGANVLDPGWRHSRSIYPEDIMLTVYSAMGIDWTKKITQTPSGRAFQYVEDISPVGVMKWAEVSELFA